MHNFVYLAQRRSQEFSCEPNFGGGGACPPAPSLAAPLYYTVIRVSYISYLDPLEYLLLVNKLHGYLQLYNKAIVDIRLRTAPLLPSAESL